MTAATLTIRGITYTSEDDLLGAACDCGVAFPAAEMTDAKVVELKAWIADHKEHQGIDERRAA